MRRRLSPGGFTVIETLIFLSVSAFVFITSINQFTTQQRNVQFNNGVRDLQSKIELMINDVTSSSTPDITGYSCTADNQNNRIVFTTTGAAANNTNCVFLGKAIGLGHDSVCSVNNIEFCSRYSIVPIAGRRAFYTPPGSILSRPPNSFAEAKPIGLATCLTNDDNANSFPCGLDPLLPTSTARPDLAERNRMTNGVGVYKAFLRNSDGTSQRSVGAAAFMLGLNRTTNDNANTVDLVWLPVDFINNTESRLTAAIDGLGNQTSDSTYLNPANGIALCILGGYGQKAEITIGANKSQLDVQVVPQSKIDSGCN